MKETVAILGGGHGAHAMAADLVSRGFSVNMYEMPQFIPNLQRLVDTKVIRSDQGPLPAQQGDQRHRGRD